MDFFHYMAVKMVRVLPGWLVTKLVFILSPKVIVGVVAIVFNEKKEVLVLHHTYRKKRPWRFPGGLAKRKENPFETAVRELKEEANIEARAIAILDVCHAQSGTLDVCVLCQTERIGSFHANVEVDDYRWVKADCIDFDLTKEQARFLEIALPFLK